MVPRRSCPCKQTILMALVFGAFPRQVLGDAWAFGEGLRRALHLARVGSDAIATAVAKSSYTRLADLGVAAVPDTTPGKMPEHGANFVVKLRRVKAKSQFLWDDVGFFVGSITVGTTHPQEFTVLFDTAAGNLVLPDRQCQSLACLSRPRYASGNGTQINSDGSLLQPGDKMRDSINISFAHIDMGEGDAVGVLVRDTVCLGPMASGGGQGCTQLGVVAARSMDEVPFRAAPWDGMLGLGLDALSVESPQFNLLRSLVAQQGVLPQFSIALRGQAGELRFGAPDPAQARAAPFRWFPVWRPEQGYWQVRIESVRVGNVTIDNCAAGCHAVVDTGASRLGVPAALKPKLGIALAVAPEAGGGCQGPDLHLDLGSGFMLTLRAQDYAGPACDAAQLTPLQLEPGEMFAGMFVLGESLLQRYDTVFDWAAKRLAFRLSSPRAVRLGLPARMADVGQGSGPDSADLFQMFQV